MRNLLVISMIALLLSGCGAGRQVARVDVDSVIDLSGKWNDTDSRLVSEEMIADCLSRPWITNFAQDQGRKPVVTVGTIRNRSEEHINTATFTKDFERELINSGVVKFVGDRTERIEVRDERQDQQIHASDETAKRLGQETGADFVMMGTISTITDQIEGRRVVYYQTDLELINVESNEKAWIGTKKIKKDITQKGKKW